MPTRFQLFKQRFFNLFIMPKEIKSEVIKKNHSLLIKISAALFILSVLALLQLFLSQTNNEREAFDYIFFYSSMAVINIIAVFLSLLFIKIEKISHLNLPVILTFFSLESLCYLLFTYSSNPFNSLIIFVCLATITPLLYAIEPLYYIITIIVMGSLMSARFVELYGSDSASNAFVYLIIMTSLAMSRWFYTKRNKVHEYKIQEREKQIQQELEMAALIQKSFYQHNLTEIKNWNIAYYNDPMISLSGDLFDFYIQDNILTGLCVFDVSGHGLASGLVTMLVKNTVEEEFYDNRDFELDFTMQRINERVRAEKGKIENYLTGILLRFVENKIEIVNAGHPNPIIYHASTDLCEFFNCDIKDRQGAIGLSDFNFDFKTLELNLKENDRIILYTDGITEAKNFLNTEYGEEQFLASVRKHRNLNVQDQITAIVDDIKHFIGTTPRTDDISIIIIEKKKS